ncbi:isochorismatase family protein [Geoalkalibacter halelectricus]|uniref:Isochorismatase family protein n=1 Tax=Geoalkalibacter halelectricus TaxID=2847045 RepID=A0ABY5ZLS4_9BACT|nr:isochorismatase family protein [Geoalkalibacter halelectricus]MDO3379047.1 isochorismatase family protein [Geoalkalibacter halelectricus]UWZ78860.1 isochorismatase family protein [Geoalkalibacter halelectricus]
MNEAVDKFILKREQAVLVVVDVQERLVPVMDQDQYAKVLRNIDFVLKSARLLDLPVVGTEQYPRGIGHMVPELADACRDKVIEKLSFGSCGEPAFVDHLKSLGRRQVIVTGMEAHVCVYQTVLGLLREGFDVHLLRDGIISRGEVDYLNALELSRAAGAVVTTAETAVFQLVGVSSDPQFKAISALVKGRTVER